MSARNQWLCDCKLIITNLWFVMFVRIENIFVFLSVFFIRFKWLPNIWIVMQYSDVNNVYEKEAEEKVWNHTDEINVKFMKKKQSHTT